LSDVVRRLSRNNGFLWKTVPSPGLTGRPSTPRLLDSIAGISGILDHPLSRVMTTVHDFAISPHAFARDIGLFPALFK
jgi:hypothetical protein